MHELSIANSLVQLATEALQDEQARTGAAVAQVREVHIQLGALAAVVKEALQFCYELATKDTLLAGSTLVVMELPVQVYCVTCDCVVDLPDIQNFRCPHCGVPSGDIRQGQELDLVAIHFSEKDSTAATKQTPVNT